MRRVSLALAGLVALAGVALAVVAVVGPRLGVVQTAVVRSGSMAPALHPGDLLIATSKPLTEVRAGDVLVFESPVEPDVLVTHRIVEVVEAGGEPVVRTKGDANESADPWLARLQGGKAWEVRHVVAGGGRALDALRGPLARALAVWLAPALLAVLWLREIWRPTPGGLPEAA